MGFDTTNRQTHAIGERMPILTRTDASTILRPAAPFTRSCGSTTPHDAFLGDIRAVEVGCQIVIEFARAAAIISSSVLAVLTCA